MQNSALIEAAVRRGARQALLRHKLAGVPIAARRDGKTVVIPPEEIEIPPDDEAPLPRKRRCAPSVR